METIVVNSRLSKKQFYKVNMYLLYRKKFVWLLAALGIVMFIAMVIINNDPNDNFPQWFGVVFLLVYASFPLAMYSGANKNYKKIKAIGEPKVYQINEESIKLDSQTMVMKIDWSHIERLYDRKDDLLAMTSNGRGIYYFPKSGFKSEQGILEFKNIVRQKGIKNNFKA